MSNCTNKGETFSSDTASRFGAWKVRTTGDMTISVLGPDGLQLLKVDLLRSGAMPAGDHGERLARTYNNLAILASIPDILAGRTATTLRSAEAGTSPLPWDCQVSHNGRGLKVRDAHGKLIASREFPTRVPAARLGEFLDLITQGVALINALLSHDEPSVPTSPAQGK